MKQILRIATSWVMTVFLISTLVICTGPAAAEDVVEILPIASVPEISLGGSGVSDRIEIGTIDRIDKKGVVVCDAFIAFAPSVIFLSAAQKPISSSRFKSGTAVGVRLNSKNKIVAMWIDTGKKP